MLSNEWLSRYGLLENFNASVTRTRTGTRTGTGTGTGTGTWTTGVTAIALCTSCSRAKNFSEFMTYHVMYSHIIPVSILILLQVKKENLKEMLNQQTFFFVLLFVLKFIFFF